MNRTRTSFLARFNRGARPPQQKVSPKEKKCEQISTDSWFVARRVVLVLDLPSPASYHRGPFLGDHDGRRVRVGRGDGRHDRGVDHAQSLEPVHAQFAIDDAHRVRTHHAGATGVIAGAPIPAGIIQQFIIGLDIAAGQALLPDELFQRAVRRTAAARSAIRR